MANKNIKFEFSVFEQTLKKRTKFLTHDRLLYIFTDKNPVITIQEFADYINLSLYVLKSAMRKIRKGDNKKSTVLGLFCEFYYIVDGVEIKINRDSPRPLAFHFEIPWRNLLEKNTILSRNSKKDLSNIDEMIFTMAGINPRKVNRDTKIKIITRFHTVDGLYYDPDNNYIMNLDDKSNPLSELNQDIHFRRMMFYR